MARRCKRPAGEIIMLRHWIRRAPWIVSLVGAISALDSAQAQDTVKFPSGKPIAMIISYGTGGGYDIYGRLVARHLGNHLPGNPKVIVKNMPGAGGLNGANHLYTVSPRDGTELG